MGSGSSYPFFKTLWLGDNKPTLDELLSDENINEQSKKAIYYYYFKNWIKPMKEFNYSDCTEKQVTDNYKIFINKLLDILNASGNERPKKANVFTTNYDSLFENTFEQHYYQLIRSFSYELETENTILIVFAFSFAENTLGRF